jgi:hypothetical protein
VQAEFIGMNELIGLTKMTAAARCRAAAAAMALLLLLAVVGCNRSGLDLAPVTGLVTFNGAPVVGAGVMFVPSQAGLPGMAITDAEGEFELKTANESGAQLGNYQVTISKVQQITIPQQHGFPLYETKSLIPQKYRKTTTSGLTAEVIDDDNHFEFSLTE